VLYYRRYGLAGAAVGPIFAAVARQAAASAVVAAALLKLRWWLGGIDHTSLSGGLRLAAVLAPTMVLYVGLVTLLGGRELAMLVATFRREKVE